MATHPTQPLVPATSDAAVGVALSAGQRRLVALRPIPAEALVLRLHGRITKEPTRYSVQVGDQQHLSPVTVAAEDKEPASLWRFMNHACDPSAHLRGLEVWSLRALQPGEEITFNYLTTEFELAEPFACRCGSPHCHGTIRGFRHLAATERERLRPWLAAHLLRRLTAAPVAGTVSSPA